MHNKRSTFSGKLGFVLSAAGASVGLGNIWRFPYLAAKYGGGIFLLIYIVLALTFGYTMIIAETTLGRMTKEKSSGSFSYFRKDKVCIIFRMDQCHYSHLDRTLLFCNRRLGHQKKVMQNYLPQIHIFQTSFQTEYLQKYVLYSLLSLHSPSFMQEFKMELKEYPNL